MSDSNKLDPPWEVRSQFYSQVGQTISLWAAMEDDLIEIAALLLRSSADKTGLVLYSIMNFHAWLNIIDDLFGIDDKHAPHRDEWTIISDELRGLNDTRVRLAHHTVWGKSEKGQEFGLKPGRYDARTKSKKYAPLTSEEIDKFSEAIQSINKKLGQLLIKMDGRSSIPQEIAKLLASRGTSAPPAGGLLGSGVLSRQIPIAPEVPPQSSEANPPVRARQPRRKKPPERP